MGGKFIVFEGVEGAGKTTQIQKTLEWLEDSGWRQKLSRHLQLEDPIIVTYEPGGTQLGQSIRRLLLDPALSATEAITDQAELLLYAADRAQHVIHLIQPHLAAGRVVLCDRFTDSTVAYQGYGRGISLDLIHKTNHLATFGLCSDLTLWFDVDITQGLKRARTRNSKQALDDDRMEANALEFHQRVQQGFAAIAQSNPQVHTINANRPLEDVSQQVVSRLQQAFAQWHPNLLPN